MTQTKHTYEVRPRKDKRGVDLISDALAFCRLSYGEPDAVSDAIGYAQLCRGFENCPRHTAMAETAARPSHGRRSRNVTTMLVLC
jgi:hypothetical protein